MRFLFIFLISMLICGTSAMADEISVAADEWMPYNGRPDSAEPGYTIEISKYIFESAGHKLIYQVIPWSRALEETREGKYNAVVGALKGDAPDFIFPEEEIGVSQTAFFVKKGSTWKYTGLESLRTVQIGLIKNYSYGEELDRFFRAKENIVQYVHGEDPLSKNINKLLYGRFDVLVEDTNVLLQKAKKMGVSDKIIKAGNAKKRNNVYIAFSPNISKSKEYADIFTNGIRNLKDSGKLEKVLAKYGLVYWK